MAPVGTRNRLRHLLHSWPSRRMMIAMILEAHLRKIIRKRKKTKKTKRTKKTKNQRRHQICSKCHLLRPSKVKWHFQMIVLRIKAIIGGKAPHHKGRCCWPNLDGLTRPCPTAKNNSHPQHLSPLKTLQTYHLAWKMTHTISKNIDSTQQGTQCRKGTATMRRQGVKVTFKNRSAQIQSVTKII